MTDNEAFEAIARLWAEYIDCGKQIHEKTRYAQQLILTLASRTGESPPNSLFGKLYSDPPTNSGDKWLLFDHKQFSLKLEKINSRAIWEEWKIGSATQPSIEYMNAKYGGLRWVLSDSDRLTVIARSKLINEIEHHLENGRELEEICMVADLSLAACENDMQKLARLIMENSDQNKPTLFEIGSSSDAS